ncbi:MAG: acetyl-CoA carboxylase biotin carboxylase subunit, partial [Candidatus Omnitrophota bacterium]
IPGGGGIRLDTHIYQGYEISPYYDSMIGKLICHGKDRKEAISICKRALDEFTIEPIKTTIPFHKKVMNNTAFLRGKYATYFVDKMFEVKE